MAEALGRARSHGARSLGGWLETVFMGCWINYPDNRDMGNEAKTLGFEDQSQDYS